MQGQVLVSLLLAALVHKSLATNPNCWSAVYSAERCCAAQDPTCFENSDFSFGSCCALGGSLLDSSAIQVEAPIDCNASQADSLYIRNDYVYREHTKHFPQEELDAGSIHAYYLIDQYRRLLNEETAHVVDIGCGIGHWLSTILRRSKRVVCLEAGESLRAARGSLHFTAQHSDASETPQVSSFAVDLDKQTEVEEGLRKVLPGSLVICSEVIEHLHDPRQGLLPLLKQMLNFGAALIVLTTPNRNAMMDYRYHRGPPLNPFHVREWSLPEFRSLLECNDLPLLHIDALHDTLYAVLSTVRVPSPAQLLASSWDALDFARSYVHTSKEILRDNAKRRSLYAVLKDHSMAAATSLVQETF